MGSWLTNSMVNSQLKLNGHSQAAALYTVTVNLFCFPLRLAAVSSQPVQSLSTFALMELITCLGSRQGML